MSRPDKTLMELRCQSMLEVAVPEGTGAELGTSRGAAESEFTRMDPEVLLAASPGAVEMSVPPPAGSSQ